ncbi:MAG: DUF1826 domain-containing protein [Crocinitomicaceae bacterium]|nr:DUF1826 domain-containing protein [Crocinitomicaceae bacterium]
MIKVETCLSNCAVDKYERILFRIHEEEINIAMYERNIDALKKDVDTLLNDDFEYRANGSAKEIIESLEGDFKSYFDGPSDLLQDIANNVELFFRTTESASFNLYLATINSNMCRRFHTDMNDMRMLCTYSGPGTLWLGEDNINREALYGTGENDTIVLNDNEIQQAKTGAVVLLKGALYPKEGTKAIVHRSPTIEESGERRLLLRIDTNDHLGYLLK